MANESTTAQVHPEKLTHALLDSAKQKGTKLKIGTVEGLNFDQDGSVQGMQGRRFNTPNSAYVYISAKTQKALLITGYNQCAWKTNWSLCYDSLSCK